MKYKLSELREHQDNNQIYSLTDLKELKDSITQHGQLEPLVITKDKVIISGHRRFKETIKSNQERHNCTRKTIH